MDSAYRLAGDGTFVRHPRCARSSNRAFRAFRSPQIASPPRNHVGTYALLPFRNRISLSHGRQRLPPFPMKKLLILFIIGAALTGCNPRSKRTVDQFNFLELWMSVSDIT